MAFVPVGSKLLQLSACYTSTHKEGSMQCSCSLCKLYHGETPAAIFTRRNRAKILTICRVPLLLFRSAQLCAHFPIIESYSALEELAWNFGTYRSVDRIGVDLRSALVVIGLRLQNDRGLSWSRMSAMDRPRIVLVRLSRMNWNYRDALRFRQSKLNRVFIRIDGFELLSALGRFLRSFWFNCV